MKILIIEDNEKNRKLFKLIITSMGHEALTAEDGEKGVRAAVDETPALILMDIQMPVLDGLSTLNILLSNEATKNIPIIAVTSYAMKGDRERLLQLGFADYIAKPVDTDEFMQIIKAALKKYHGHE